MAEFARLFMKLHKQGQPDSEAAWVKGESEVTEFRDEIELEDWSWNLSRSKDSGSLGSIGGSRSTPDLGGIEPSRFTFSKRLDRSTATMLTHMASGTLLQAQIAFEEASDLDFELVIRLSEVRVVGYEMDGEMDDKSAEVKEKWTFDYREIQFEYKPNAKNLGRMLVQLERKPGASKDDPDNGLAMTFKTFDKLAPKADKDVVEKQLKDKNEKYKAEGKSKKGNE